jgi:hypothetical protein
MHSTTGQLANAKQAPWSAKPQLFVEMRIARAPFFFQQPWYLSSMRYETGDIS